MQRCARDKSRSVRLPRVVAAALILLGRLWPCALCMTATKIGTVRAEATTAAMTTATMPAETILTTIALIVAVLVLGRILLRLAAAAGDERR